MALHHISKIFPRNSKKLVFIGWHRNPEKGEIFADNTKYLFLFTKQNNPELRPIWMAKSKSVEKELRSFGYESYYEKSILGIWHALTSGKTIIDAFIQPENIRWCGGSKIIQLMHGRGMKKNAYNSPQDCTQDLIFVTSEFTKSLLPKLFTRGSRVHITGYPRNDIFFQDIIGSEIHSEIEFRNKALTIKKNNSKIILYSPTFRRGESYSDFEKRLDLKNLSKWSVENNIHFTISLHPKYRNQLRNIDLENIIFLNDCDIYPILKFFDLFINDYSSIFVDQLLLNKPMVFFPYDLENYERTEGIAFDYKELVPGPIVYSTDDLLKKIVYILENDEWKDKREINKKTYHKYLDGNSSKRIIEIIKNEK